MTQNLETDRKLPRRREYAIGIVALVLIIILSILIARNWHDVEQVASYGLIGGFIFGILGGGTIPLPLPAIAVYFTLGGLLTPWVGPAALGPAIVGLVCGLGETIGGLSTYATGFSGATPLKHWETNAKPNRLNRLYRWIMEMMNRRGNWVLFWTSVLINPFFYPVSLAAGVSRFGVKRYFVICLAGKIIKCAGVAYAGYWGLRGVMGILGVDV